MSNERERILHVEHNPPLVGIPTNYADETWKILEHAIHQIYSHNANACGLYIEELCREAYNMMRHKFGEKVYSGLATTMTALLKDMTKSVEATQGYSFLKELNTKWNDHNEALQIIEDALMYMDSVWVTSTQKTPVRELGLNLWREIVILSSEIKTRLSNTLLGLVHGERNGEVIDRGMMRNVTKMLMDLGPSVYEEEFEARFLLASAEFYRVESQRLIESCDCGDYLKKVQKRMNEEMDRVSHYLDPMTEKKITNVVVKEMINKLFGSVNYSDPDIVSFQTG